MLAETKFFAEITVAEFLCPISHSLRYQRSSRGKVYGKSIRYDTVNSCSPLN